MQLILCCKINPFALDIFFSYFLERILLKENIPGRLHYLSQKNLSAQ
jgi:hypothetical protein